MARGYGKKSKSLHAQFTNETGVAAAGRRPAKDHAAARAQHAGDLSPRVGDVA